MRDSLSLMCPVGFPDSLSEAISIVCDALSSKQSTLGLNEANEGLSVSFKTFLILIRLIGIKCPYLQHGNSVIYTIKTRGAGEWEGGVKMWVASESIMNVSPMINQK